MSDDLHIRAIEILRAGASDYTCARYLRSISELERLDLFTKLEYERLQRKYEWIMDIYRNDVGGDWTQLLFFLVMDMISDEPNRSAFRELARRVPVKYMLRDVGANPHYAEAMLAGATGLLDGYVYGGYTMALNRDAKYLLHKYGITPLVRENWSFQRVTPDVIMLKLSQVAQLFTQVTDLFDRVIACNYKVDVEQLFGVAESEICAKTHVSHNADVKPKLRKISSEKCNIMGINVVVLLQYTYGYYTQSEEMCSRAQELNESLSPDSNRFIKAWRERGVMSYSSFESQALLELSKVYCKGRLCDKCHVGRRASRDLSWLNT